MTRMARLTYPTPPTADQVDDYHGHADRRPVPAARGQRRAGDAGLDRGAERADRARPRRVRGADEIRDRLAELWDFPRARRPVAARRPLVPAAQHRPPGPGRAVDGRRAGRGGDRAPRPEPAERGGHDHAVGDRGQRERRARRVRDQRRRLRLAHVDRPTRRDRRGAARPDPVEQVHARPPGPTTTPASSTAATRSRRPTRPTTRRTTTWSCATTGSAPMRPTTSLVFATPDEPEWSFEPEVLGRRPAARPHRLTAAPTPRTASTSPTSRTASSAAIVRPLLDEADAHYEPIADDRRRAVPRRPIATRPLGRVIAVDLDDPARVRGDHPGGRRRARARQHSSATGSPPCTSTTPTTGWRCSSSTGGTWSTSRCRASA